MENVGISYFRGILKRAIFLVCFEDQNHQNRNFTFSKIIVTIILITIASLTRAVCLEACIFTKRIAKLSISETNI